MALDLRKIAIRIASKMRIADDGSVLDAVGRSADLGQDQKMTSTHSDVDEDDIETSADRVGEYA